MNTQTGKTARHQQGIVASVAMQKTIVVRIARQVRHPLYEKMIWRSAKILAHDENEIAKVGDRVVIGECRPLSKRKSWQLLHLVDVDGNVLTEATLISSGKDSKAEKPKKSKTAGTKAKPITATAKKASPKKTASANQAVSQQKNDNRTSRQSTGQSR